MALNSYYKKREVDSVRQNTSSTIFFVLNPLHNFFNQQSIEIGYQFNGKYYFGIEGGFIRANNWWNTGWYDGTDDWFPFGHYNGWLLFLHCKKLNVTSNHWYFEFTPIYKYLTYDHNQFSNSWGDKYPYVNWIRSEKTNMVGIKLLMGKRIFFSDHFAIEPYLGVSLKNYFRSYITHKVTTYSGAPSDFDGRTNVLIHKNLFFPEIQAGILFTLGNFKIKS